MRRILASIITTTLLCVSGPQTPACGPFFPRQYLAEGGMSLLGAPEFFAEIELKLLALEYPTPFKAVHEEQPRFHNTERDIEEFNTAIEEGSIRPPDAATARAAHERMREVINQFTGLTKEEHAGLPDDLLKDLRKRVFASEFADYHEGAIAYAAQDHAKARAAWERLLTRPEAERKYRSVNAAFMIGVLASVDSQDDAAKWLAMARELAQKGFHDPAGLAAASYYWESEWHKNRGELRQAAECHLRSISAGYASRHGIEPANDSPEELAKFANDPLLRRMYTSILLANNTGGWTAWAGTNESRPKIEAWLAAVEAANTGGFAGAERVGWMHYVKGDYTAAKRWVKHAPAQSPEGLWLRGKLAARDGRRADSLKALAEASRLLAKQKEPELEVTTEIYCTDTPSITLAADFATAAIGAAEFRTALDAFLRGGHWEDAAHVAERLLTIDELRAYVAKLPWTPVRESLTPDQFAAAAKEEMRAHQFRWSGGDKLDDPRAYAFELRWLLARRLAREGRFAEARPYYPLTYRAPLDAYVRGLEQGRRGSSEARANALWDAALEARYNGMNLLGTETAPDWRVYGGSYQRDDPAAFRMGNAKLDAEDGKAPDPLPAVLRAGATERARLQKSEASPNRRLHYRYRASELAWRAAKLLPDNDPQLAEMLNLAGRWISAKDPDAADRFYQALESRCAATDIGRRATARRWFVDVETYTIRREAVFAE